MQPQLLGWQPLVVTQRTAHSPSRFVSRCTDRLSEYRDIVLTLMATRMMDFIRRNTESIQTALHVVVAVIPIIIGAACLYYDYHGADPTHLFVFGVIIPLAVYLTIISELAIIWLFKHLHAEASVYVETYTDAVLFANRRAAIVGSIEPKRVRYDMFSTSHCNLFARPEGENPAETDIVARLNRHLFESMAKIALSSESQGRIRVLFYAEDKKDLEFELDQREEILGNVSQRLGRRWDADHFRFGMLSARSLMRGYSAQSTTHVSSKG